jgi:hypothetical protein
MREGRFPESRLSSTAIGFTGRQAPSPFGTCTQIHWLQGLFSRQSLSELVIGPDRSIAFRVEARHIGLVLLASPSEPVEDVGIDAKAHQLFDRPIETAHLYVGRSGPPFRRIRIVDLGIGLIGKTL